MEAPSSPPPAPAGAAYDAEMLADLEGLFGRPRLLTLLAGLRNEIDARLSDPPDDPVALGKNAHVLVSTCGALGFMTLSRACVELERACLAGTDVSGRLADVRQAAGEARRSIDALCNASA